MKREMNNYTWIVMTVMLLWSVALFATNAPKGNNQSDNRPFRYTLVQGKTAPPISPSSASRISSLPKERLLRSAARHLITHLPACAKV